MSEVLTVPISQVVPREDQPRQHFDEGGIRELADSMLSKGFLAGNRLVVRRNNSHYELLAGHRRRLAAIMAGLQEVPVEIVQVNDQEAREIVLLDNMNREDFLPWEAGAGFAELIDKHNLSIAALAQKAGKSVGYVKSRIDIARTAGDAVRKEYLDGEVGLAVLQEVSALPNKDLAPVRCPQCQVINAEGSERCAACQQYLSGQPRLPQGNPQSAAARLVRGKDLEQARRIIRVVLETYGLSDRPVQTSLGLSDMRLGEDVVRAKSGLERKLEQVGQLQAWLVENKAKLAQLTSDQLAAIAQQGKVIEGVGRYVQEVAGQELGRRRR